MPVAAEGFPTVARDYFELFQLPVEFDLDLDDLAGRFRVLQRKFHPDRFASQGIGERRAAAQLSADINSGYRVLCDPVARAGFMLERVGCDLKALEREPVDGGFLMRQIELREALRAPGSSAAEPRAQAVAEAKALMEAAVAGFRAAIGEDDLTAAGGFYVQLLYLKKLNTEVAVTSEPV